jgi:hypothetical protein
MPIPAERLSRLVADAVPTARRIMDQLEREQLPVVLTPPQAEDLALAVLWCATEAQLAQREEDRGRGP